MFHERLGAGRFCHRPNHNFRNRRNCNFRNRRSRRNNNFRNRRNRSFRNRKYQTMGRVIFLPKGFLSYTKME